MLPCQTALSASYAWCMTLHGHDMYTHKRKLRFAHPRSAAWAPWGPIGPQGGPHGAPQRGGGMYGVIFIAMGWLKLVVARPPLLSTSTPFWKSRPNFGGRQPHFGGPTPEKNVRKKSPYPKSTTTMRSGIKFCVGGWSQIFI